RPPAEEGWLELLITGLAFDLVGLAPAAALPTPAVRHRFGVAGPDPEAPLEAVVLRPGAHLAGGENLLPVVRAMMQLAVDLAGLGGVEAVIWAPAATMMGRDYFLRNVGRWLEGGAFPALGLTALLREADGAICSDGLAFFTGQELRIEPTSQNGAGGDGKIAIRLIHSLVSGGDISPPCLVDGPEGEVLRIEPARSGGLWRVWRAAG
ncbi:MAG TPA: hypothetical protein VFF94_02675, partial [Novosphingobium sp.]|nr:hypothetical protein [Novosphingobium sp.]